MYIIYTYISNIIIYQYVIYIYVYLLNDRRKFVASGERIAYSSIRGLQFSKQKGPENSLLITYHIKLLKHSKTSIERFEKGQVTYKDRPARMTQYYSPETFKDRRMLKGVFQILKSHNDQSKL